jgi:hypothetical protein
MKFGAALLTLIALLSSAIAVNARSAAPSATGVTCTPDSAGEDFCDDYCQDLDFDYGECNESKFVVLLFISCSCTTN